MSNHAPRKISQNCVGEGLCPSRAERTNKYDRTNAEWNAPKPPLGDQGEVARRSRDGRDEKVYVLPHYQVVL